MLFVNLLRKVMLIVLWINNGSHFLRNQDFIGAASKAKKRSHMGAFFCGTSPLAITILALSQTSRHGHFFIYYLLGYSEGFLNDVL